MIKVNYFYFKLSLDLYLKLSLNPYLKLSLDLNLLSIGKIDYISTPLKLIPQTFQYIYKMRIIINLQNLISL